MRLDQVWDKLPNARRDPNWRVRREAARCDRILGNPLAWVNKDPHPEVRRQQDWNQGQTIDSWFTRPPESSAVNGILSGAEGQNSRHCKDREFGCRVQMPAGHTREDRETEIRHQRQNRELWARGRRAAVRPPAES